MSRNLIGQQNTGGAINLPGQMVQRFDNQMSQGNIQNASSGKTVPSLQPIDFTPANRYIDQMAAIANVGEGLFNAAVKIKGVADASEKSARDAYLASVETDDIVQTNRIYNENAVEGNNPEDLALKLEEYRDGKRNAMPAEIQSYYTNSFDKRAAVLTVKSQDAFFQKSQADSKASLENGQKIIVDDVYATPVPKSEVELQAFQDKITKVGAVIQSRVDHGFITPQEAELETKSFRKDLLITQQKFVLEKLGPNARAKEIFAFQQKGQLPAGFNVNDKEDIVKQLNAYSDTIESTKKQAFAQENAAAALQKARMNADLEINVERGEATYEDVQRAESKQQITPEKKAALFKALDNATEKKITKAESIHKMARVLDGKDYIDPQNSDDKKTVDMAYTEIVLPQMAAMQDPAAQKTLLTNYIQASGVVPSSLQGKIRGVFRGGNVQDKVFYADLVGRIIETKPQALDDFDNKDVTQAMMIDQLVKAGTPNEEAVKRVEDSTVNITPGRIEILKTQFQDLKNAKGGSATDRNATTIKYVANLFDEGVLSGDATLPNRQLGVEVAAVNDYNRVYETAYLNSNGDEDIAKQQADRIFKSSWGTTAINGQSKQLTKYPIEKAYPDLDTVELKKSLMKDLRSLPEYKDVSDDKVFLQYDARTAREWGNNPSYQVLILNKNGVIEPVADVAKSRWQPAYAKEVGDKRVNAKMEAYLMGRRSTPNEPLTSKPLISKPKNPALKQSVKDAGAETSLGDKIFSVFISDAGAAEPSPSDLQQFAAQENLSEEHVQQVMQAQNKQAPGSYTKSEIKVMPALIKSRYYRSPPLNRGVTLGKPSMFDDLNEKEVRDLMAQRNKNMPTIAYSSEELDKLPAQIVARYYRRHAN